MKQLGRVALATLVVTVLVALTGCASLLDRAANNFADDLEAAIRAYDEPTVVSAGLPAFLLLMEARLQSRPNDVGLRLTTARLTGTYATLFADQNAQEREQRLTRRALDHARIGACQHSRSLCELDRLDFEALEDRIDTLGPGQVEAVYVLATSWTTWIAAHAQDFRALADLPRVESLLTWVAATEPGYDDGAVYLYLAVLNSQRPPAAGGQPRKARDYFERARASSQGRNQLVNVMMADSYARLLFDRDLYVELLETVLQSDNDHPDYRLVNQVARSRALILLEQTEELFD